MKERIPVDYRGAKDVRQIEGESRAEADADQSEHVAADGRDGGQRERQTARRRSIPCFVHRRSLRSGSLATGPGDDFLGERAVGERAPRVSVVVED